jgi:hypothetical protein
MNKNVILSIEDDSGMHCVDFIENDDGSFSYKAFRKDPEDEGKWTLTADYSATRFTTQQEAFAAAAQRIPWLAASLPSRP